jgi:hypothetical protein
VGRPVPALNPTILTPTLSPTTARSGPGGSRLSPVARWCASAEQRPRFPQAAVPEPILHRIR